MEANPQGESAPYGGDLLKEWRKSRRLYTQEVCELLGVSRSRVSQLETDPSEGPGLDLAQTIERVTDGAVPVSSWRKQFAVMVSASESAEKGAA